MRSRTRIALLQGERNELARELADLNHVLQHVIVHVAARQGIVVDMAQVMRDAQSCADRRHPAVIEAEMAVAEADARRRHPTGRDDR
jgi:hypothetical protein